MGFSGDEQKCQSSADHFRSLDHHEKVTRCRAQKTKQFSSITLRDKKHSKNLKNGLCEKTVSVHTSRGFLHAIV